MTPQEAISILERLQEPEEWEPQITFDAFDALELAIEALEDREQIFHLECLRCKKPVGKHSRQTMEQVSYTHYSYCEDCLRKGLKMLKKQDALDKQSASSEQDDHIAESDKMIKLEKRTITERLIIAESLINSVIVDSDQFREDAKKTDDVPDIHVGKIPYKKPEIIKYERHYDHTDCIWYRYLGEEEPNECPSTCSQYRDGWNDAMDYIFCNGKGYQPYERKA